jgi:chemotaxis protein MotB
MSDEQQQQPIIIKKVKGGHGGHHGGSWKVAFADFMTAMMAFFLVMWAVGQSQQIKEAIGGYFRDPGKFQTEGSAGILRGSRGVIPMDQETVGLRQNNPDASGGPSDSEKRRMSEAGLRIIKELQKERAFRKLEGNVQFQMTAEGLRIILNESKNAPAFFEPGSAKLLQKSAIIVATIARELGKLENRLVIEGHTDAAYGGSGDYTNWELSADRANAARQLMEVSGLRPGQVREVRGFADKRPMIVDDPLDARNRRVSILVLYRSVDQRYEELEVGQDLMEEIEQKQ